MGEGEERGRRGDRGILLSIIEVILEVSGEVRACR